ncbi:hypothetical protein JVU11DRAFT_8543 [Chiua virens]|nr:hypothetical protein JVU11DRAFT_8543 [Chiua virens]
MQILLSARRAHKKSNTFYAVFSTMMLFLVTVWVATQAFFGEKMWILDSNFPGGPDVYWKANISVWYMDWGTTAVVLLQLMTDALMIHRCRVVWNSHQIIIVPVILWLASLVLGILVDWTTSSPGGDFFSGIASQIGLAYYTVSVVLNTILTCLICYRMMRYAKSVQEHLGREYASLYFSIVTLIVESVLPYTLSGIAFLVTMGMGSPTSVAFVCVYILMMCISPQMLILRVIVGRAWDETTLNQPGSTLKFTPPGMGPPQPIDNIGQRIQLQTMSDAYIPDSKV